MKLIPIWLPIALSLACIGAAQAQPADGGGAPPRGGPPAEAVAACKGKTSGASCSFTGRQNETLSGTCDSPPEGPPGSSNTNSSSSSSGTLACRPARPSGPPPQR